MVVGLINWSVRRVVRFRRCISHAAHLLFRLRWIYQSLTSFNSLPVLALFNTRFIFWVDAASIRGPSYHSSPTLTHYSMDSSYHYLAWHVRTGA
jgi:hypothetical protein